MSEFHDSEKADPRAAIGVPSSNPVVLDGAAPLRFAAAAVSFDFATGNATIPLNVPPNSFLAEIRLDLTPKFDGTAPTVTYKREAAGAPGTDIWSASLSATSVRSALIGTGAPNANPNGLGFVVLALGGATKGAGLLQVAFMPKAAWLLEGPDEAL